MNSKKTALRLVADLINPRCIMKGSHSTADEIGERILGDDAITFENACAPGRVERGNGAPFDVMFLQARAP
jgi:hypothetical protein